jgi:hypothetical protein
VPFTQAFTETSLSMNSTGEGGLFTLRPMAQSSLGRFLFGERCSLIRSSPLLLAAFANKDEYLMKMEIRRDI